MTHPTFYPPSTLHVLTAFYNNGTTCVTAVAHLDEIDVETRRLQLPRPVLVDTWKREGAQWTHGAQSWR